MLPGFLFAGVRAGGRAGNFPACAPACPLPPAMDGAGAGGQACYVYLPGAVQEGGLGEAGSGREVWDVLLLFPKDMKAARSVSKEASGWRSRRILPRSLTTWEGGSSMCTLSPCTGLLSLGRAIGDLE